MHYLEDDQNDQFDVSRFHPNHTLVPIQSGPRCRVSARRHNKPSRGFYCGKNICVAYKSGDFRFYLLVWNLCALQGHFKTWCEQHLNRPWDAVSSLGPAEAWWWEMVNVFYNQCERILPRIGSELQSMLRQGWAHGMSPRSQTFTAC